MAATLHLGVWTNPNQPQRLKLDNINLEDKVETFRNVASKQIDTSNTELSFCGVILEDDKTLLSYGITSGVTIHVLNKLKVVETISPKTLSDVEINQIVNLLKEYKGPLQRLSRQEILDKILLAIPGLNDDPAALALIQDPDLVIQLGEVETIRKIGLQHPVLIDVFNYIRANISELETPDSRNQASTSSGYSYSLEALSDDDDMDNSDSSANPLTRNSSYNAITAAQLAAAIANATNTAFNTNSAGMPSTPTGSNTSGSVITSEMFSNAIQQAFASSGQSASPTARPMEETMSELRTRLMPQLQQMHEMGLINDSVNIRALQATSGDVQAAVELVFNRVID